MSSVWETRFARFVQHVTAQREGGTLDLLPDLMPVLPLVDPRAPELCVHRNERLVTAGGDLTAAAGQFPTVWVGLPAASGNNLLILTDLIVSVVTSQTVRWAAVQSALPGGPTVVNTDDEREPNQVASALHVTESAVAQFGSSRRSLLAANTPARFPLQQVIPPGFAFRVQGDLVASRLVVVMLGYERAGVSADEGTRRS